MSTAAVRARDRLLRSRRHAIVAASLALFAVFILVAAGACSDEDPSAAGDRVSSSSSASASRGAELYERECLICHGDNGDRLPIAPLNSVTFLNSRGDATLLAVVNDGKGTMQAFGEGRGGPFGVDDVREVVAYLNVLAGRASTTLLAAEGQIVYERLCLSCHGPTGDRIPIAPLDAQGFLDARTDSELADVVLNGTGTMTGFGGSGRDALTQEGATAVISFLRYRVQERTVESVGKGRDLYVGNCLACHGTGGDRVGDVELASASFLTDLGDGALIAAIARGTETGPAFGTAEGGAFDVPDTAALIAYLKSWAGLSATAALSTGLNTGLVGEPLFVQNCAPCHGPTGDGVAGVQLKSPTFLEQKTRGVVAGTIQVGNEKGMPAWSIEAGGSLTDEQIESIVEFLFSSAGVTSGGSGGAITDSPFGDLTAAEFFGANCAGCHGADRSGGVGPALLPDRLTEADDFYIDTILNGRPGTPMPVWKDQGITPEQAAALVGFLKGEEAAAAAPADDGGSTDANAPIFDGETPAEFFAANCAACHGADRSGGIGPALTAERLTEPADFYIDTILNGRPGTPMPVWKDQGVTPEQAAAMVAYLTDDGDSTSSVAPEGGGDGALFDGATAVEFFASKCAACHGADRSGGIGPALLPERLTEADDFYIDTILNGRPGTPMPVWKDQGVTAEQAAALVGFIKSDPAASSSTTPTASSTTPIVSPAQRLFGQALFENTCALCHGKDGLQVPQCPLGNPEWINNMSYEGLVTRISRGKPSQGMPTWSDRYGGPLTDEQIASVANYLAVMSRSR